MSVTPSNLPEPAVPTLPVARFTADQYVEMIRAGILGKEDRVELIDGIITPMSPSGPDHTWAVFNLTRLMRPAMESHFVGVQGTVRIGNRQMFDPDVILIRQRGPEQQLIHPQATDIELVIEVANTSLKKDREEKARAYAEAGIGEYWIADIQGEQVWVHREPSGSAYGSIVSHGMDEVVTPLATPSIEFPVREIFAR